MFDLKFIHVKTDERNCFLISPIQFDEERTSRVLIFERLKCQNSYVHVNDNVRFIKASITLFSSPSC